MQSELTQAERAATVAIDGRVAARLKPRAPSTGEIFRAARLYLHMRNSERDWLTADAPLATTAGLDDLVPLVYEELRRIAHAYMRRERQDQTIQTTDLVHEAWIRLSPAVRSTQDRHRFLSIAAHVMRQILVDRARARAASKRWGGLGRVPLTDALAAGNADEAMIAAVDDALTSLEQIDPEQARIVELRFFAGLSVEETAAALQVSPATLKRRWSLARAWLLRELDGGGR